MGKVGNPLKKQVSDQPLRMWPSLGFVRHPALGSIPFAGSVIVIDAGFVCFRNTSAPTATSLSANVHPETDKIVEYFHCGT